MTVELENNLFFRPYKIMNSEQESSVSRFQEKEKRGEMITKNDIFFNCFID